MSREPFSSAQERSTTSSTDTGDLWTKKFLVLGVFVALHIYQTGHVGLFIWRAPLERCLPVLFKQEERHMLSLL